MSLKQATPTVFLEKDEVSFSFLGTVALPSFLSSDLYLSLRTMPKLLKKKKLDIK